MTVSLPEQSAQQRRTARIAGWLMASTFLTSILAALILYDPVLNDTNYILGAGDDARVTLGALLEIFLMIGNVGTAVVMFPILRRYSETLSLSYVASRTIEATIIGVGAISLLSVITLRDDLAGVHRCGRNLARHRGTSPGRGARLDVPARARILRWRQRHAARLDDVPHRIDAAAARDAGRRRRPADLRVVDRGPVRRLRAGR